MQSSLSISSLASSCSSHSSSSSTSSATYGSRTVLDVKDLPAASARCRSSIVSSLDNDDTMLSPPQSPPPPPPRRRQSHVPAQKCRQLFRSCLSSTASPMSIPIKTKLSTSSSIRERYFAQLCQSHRLLLVLNDYECRCGCHFSMHEGQFVVLYDGPDNKSSSSSLSSKKEEDRCITVISSDLVCSKIPVDYVCDVELLRERVRHRQMYSDEQSFDL